MINSNILSMVWYLATVNLISNRTAVDIERKMFKFLWRDMEKLNRPTITLPFGEGGLGLNNLKLKCKTLQVKYILRSYLVTDSARSSFTKYWTNIALRNHFPEAWDNSSGHNISPDRFHSVAVTSFKDFKKIHPEEVNLKVCTRVVYGHLVKKEIAPPKALALPDHVRRAEAWRRLKKLPLSAEVIDLFFLISHDVLPVAVHIFRFHIVKHNLCTICYRETETITHCLFNCAQAKPLWKLVFHLAPAISHLPLEDLALLNYTLDNRNQCVYTSIIVSEAWLETRKFLIM